MSLVKKSLPVFGKLAVVSLLLAAFVVGLGGVLMMSLRSKEVKVPAIIGKDFGEGERELAQSELKIRKRTDRFSQEKPNTILEQSPAEGEILKTGQTVAVVVARAEAIGDEKPAEVKKDKTKDEDKPKGVDEPTEVDKARQKRKAANKNANTNKNGNANGNANNSNGNSNSGASNANNSNGGNNNARNNNARNSNGGATGANTRPANTNPGTRPTGNTNRRNQ